jgi:hypothetical protein
MDSLSSNVPAFDSSELKELKEKLVDGVTFSIARHHRRLRPRELRIPGTQAFLTIAE